MYVKEDVHGFSTVTGQREGYRCVGRRSEVTGIHISEREQEDKRTGVTMLVLEYGIRLQYMYGRKRHNTTHDNTRHSTRVNMEKRSLSGYTTVYTAVYTAAVYTYDVIAWQ